MLRPSFNGNVERLLFSNCNLFKRSFTNKGIGYTFNNDIEERLIHQNYFTHSFYPNRRREPSLMKSASPDHALTVVIENNIEEIESFKKTINTDNPKGEAKYEPTKVTVSLHNPSEPADVRTKSFRIPLGQSTIVYITPRAREIDQSGEDLTEEQRNCRLNQNTNGMNIFNTYTRSACLFECKMKHAIGRCGCTPWNYPFEIKS